MPAQQVVPITADIDMESLALIGCAVTDRKSARC